MKAQFYLFLFCFLSPILLAAQPGSACGFDPDPAAIQWMNQQREAIQRFNADPSMRNRLRTIKRVPLRFVAFNSAKTAGLAQADVNLALANLNKAFQPIGLEFFSCQTPVNVISPTYADFLYSEESDLWKTYQNNKVINVFCFESIEKGGVSGYTKFPWNSPVYAIFIDKRVLTSTTLVHEMGHYYGLYHTHGKSNCEETTDELVNDPNCDKTGDDVCDTPADPNLSGPNCSQNQVAVPSCVYFGTAKDKNGDTYKPDPRNFMSYASPLCRNYFSPGQYDRMGYFAQFRIYPEECPPPICYTPSITKIDSTYTSLSIEWTAFAEDSIYQVRYRTGADTSWKISTLTTNLLRITNLQPCTVIELALRRNCGSGFSEWVSVSKLKTLGCAGSYCASYGGKENPWINSVKIGDWTNSSGDNDGYLLHSAGTLSLKNKQIYTIQLEPGGALRIRDSLFWQIWIDKNQDKDFEDVEELVYRGKSSFRNTHQGTFELPANLAAGTSRMRITLSLNQFSTSACSVGANVLETEDYTIKLSPDPICPKPDSSQITLKQLSFASVTLQAKGLDASTYQWEIFSQFGQLMYRSPESSADSLIVAKLFENTRYQARLRVICNTGNYSEWSGPFKFSTTITPCPAPDSSSLTASEVTNFSAQLNCAANANAYYYQFYYREQGTEVWENTFYLTTNFGITANLKPNTVYEYRVRIFCTPNLSNISPYSKISTFRTPLMPCLTLPSRDQIKIEVLQDTALQFTYVDEKQVFQSLNWRYRKFGTSTWITLSGNIAKPNRAEFGELFEVSAQGICQNGLASDWSFGKAFSTPCAPPKLSELHITQLRISDAKIAYRGIKRTAFSWEYKQAADSLWSNFGYSEDTIFTLGNLTASTAYQFRMNGRCPSGWWSPNSESLQFTTADFPCGIPDTSTFEARNITDNSALLTCAAVPGARYYVFNYRKKGDPGWNSLISTIGSQGILKNLESNTVYEFTVQIACLYEGLTELSILLPSVEFKTKPQICPSVQPGQVNVLYVDIKKMELKCTQDAKAYAWRYRLLGTEKWIDSLYSDSARWVISGLAFPALYEAQIKVQCFTGTWSDWTYRVFETPDISCTQPNARYINSTIVQDSFTRLTYLIPGYIQLNWRFRPVGELSWGYVSDSLVRKGLALELAREYEFEVQGVCIDLEKSPWSDSKIVSGPCLPIPTSTIKILNVGTHSARIYCTAENINELRWRIRTKGSEVWHSEYTTTDREIIFSGYNSETTLEFQVQRICSKDSESKYSEILSFTTSAIICQPLDEIQINATRIGTQTAVIKSDYLDIALEYLLAYRKKGAMNWDTTSPKMEPSWELFGLESNTEYEYQVGIICEYAKGSVWSKIKTFKTLQPGVLCPTPDPNLIGLRFQTQSTLSFFHPLEGTVTLNWRYRKLGDSLWIALPNTPNYVLQIDPKFRYEVSLQRSCSSSIKSAWTLPVVFNALCRLSPDELEIKNKAEGEIEVSTSFPAQQYYWSYRKQSAGKVEREFKTTQNSLSIDSLAPGLNYVIGLRAYCFHNDSSNLVFRTFKPLCKPIAVEEVRVINNGPQQTLFECLNLSYKGYEWQYQPKGSGFWSSIYENGAQAIDLVEPTYELQVRGLCTESGGWSDWSPSITFEPSPCGLPDSLNIISYFDGGTKVHLLAENSVDRWYATQFKWYYRISGQTEWIDSIATEENILSLEDLQPGTQYELELKITCSTAVPNKVRFQTTFTTPLTNVQPKRIDNLVGNEAAEKQQKYALKPENDSTSLVLKVSEVVAPLEKDGKVITISDKPLAKKLIIFPNPSPGRFSIQNSVEFGGPGTLSIYGSDGRQVLQRTLENVAEAWLDIDLSEHPAGLYFVRLLAGKVGYTEKLLLQKP